MYARVQDGTITDWRATLPDLVWAPATPTTGNWLPLTEANAADHGWLPVVDDPRPDDTDTTRWQRQTTVEADRVVRGWVEVALTDDELDARHAADRPAALEAATRLTVTEKLTTDALDDDTVATLAPLFDRWKPGITVAVGDVLAWDGTLVEVIQAHTTQADWTPDQVPALFKVHRTPGMTEWVAGISVDVGEQFVYNGTTYEVLQAHTTQAGWEPPNVPALWAEVV